MMTRRGMLLAVVCTVIMLMGTTGVKAATGDDILANMMSNDMMVANQAINSLREGALSADKARFEKAKDNLIVIINTPSKMFAIRISAADALAFFQHKKALPALKNALRSEQNPAIQMTFKNAIDRLEGRQKGKVYEEKPAYSGTPAYHGTPMMHGTPGRRR